MGDVRQLRQTPTRAPLRAPTTAPLRAPTTASLRAPARPRPVEPLWRDVLGAQLRAIRLHRRLTITTTAGRAGISAQYLSEVERGRKDPSSEIVAAIAGALDCTLAEITDLTVRELRRASAPAALDLRSTTSAPIRANLQGPVALAA